MPTTQVINMTARSSSSLNYNDFLYLTKEAPLTDEKVQASVVRDYVLSGVKTSANSGLAQTSSAYAAANPEYELSVDASNLSVVTAVAADYILIQDVTDGSTKKALISDVVTTGDIEGVTAGTNLNGGGTTGTVTLNLDTTITGLSSVTSTSFVGALTGNADTATTAATVTGGTQAAITSTANLVTVGTIGTGVWQGTDIAAGYIADTAVTPGSYTLASITVDAQGRLTDASTGSGTGGDVVGPSSAIDNSVARFDTTTGKLIQDTGSSFVISDAGAVTAGSWTGTAVDGAYVDLEGTELKSTGETGATKYLREDGDGTSSWQTVSGAGIGDVSGPSSATNNSVARFDTTSGKLIQDTGAYFTISDAGVAAGYNVTLDGDKNITPGDGSMIHVDTATLTDNVTSTSGTATKFTSNNFEGQTLAATNASVTTSDAATVYISGPTIAGTNETLTRTHALWVDSGNARFDGSIYSGTTEAINSSGLVTVANQSNITGVSTITSGTWNGTEVGLGYGGTELVGETDGKIVIADGAGAPVHLDVGSSTGITILGTVATGTWNGTAIDGTYVDIEGTEVKSTGETGGTKFLREDGDNSCSWQTVAAGATAGFAVAMAIAL